MYSELPLQRDESNRTGHARRGWQNPEGPVLVSRSWRPQIGQPLRLAGPIAAAIRERLRSVTHEYAGGNPADALRATLLL